MLALQKLEILLASKSPRRQQLLKEMGLRFSIVHQDVEEDFPSDIPVTEVAEYLAGLKAEAVKDAIVQPNQVILASDTTVVLGDQIFNKPADAEEAASFLRTLSGQTHQVITGVCFLHQKGSLLLSDTTNVEFMELSEAEIDYYIQTCKPYDKAGAYAIQEWIGLNKIKSIEGSYFNVVGLPTQAVYAALEHILQVL
jgi:septum formation protein